MPPVSNSSHSSFVRYSRRNSAAVMDRDQGPYGQGAAVYCAGSSAGPVRLTFSNNLLIANQALSGTIFISGGQASLTNNTTLVSCSQRCATTRLSCTSGNASTGR